jgi:hypothetical protein
VKAGVAVLTVAPSLLAAPHAVATQPAGKAFRVGFLIMARNPGVESSFPGALRDLGYVEGRDVIIEWRDAEGHDDRVPALAADLVRLGVNVIVAVGPEARLVAMKATSTIPIGSPFPRPGGLGQPADPPGAPSASVPAVRSRSRCWPTSSSAATADSRTRRPSASPRKRTGREGR